MRRHSQGKGKDFGLELESFIEKLELGLVWIGSLKKLQKLYFRLFCSSSVVWRKLGLSFRQLSYRPRKKAPPPRPLPLSKLNVSAQCSAKKAPSRGVRAAWCEFGIGIGRTSTGQYYAFKSYVYYTRTEYIQYYYIGTLSYLCRRDSDGDFSGCKTPRLLLRILMKQPTTKEKWEKWEQ